MVVIVIVQNIDEKRKKRRKNSKKTAKYGGYYPYFELYEGSEGDPDSDKIMLYSFVPKENLDAIKKWGLAGTRGIVENPELLAHIFPDEAERQAFVDRYDPSDITLQGPSVFFQSVPVNYIVGLDKEHILTQGDYILIGIDWSQLSQDHPSARIHGVELIPYNDEEYEDKKSEIEHVLDHNEISHLASMPYHHAWSNYVSGYFAGNVPHGIVILDGGIIPPEYLSL